MLIFSFKLPLISIQEALYDFKTAVTVTAIAEMKTSSVQTLNKSGRAVKF